MLWFCKKQYDVFGEAANHNCLLATGGKDHCNRCFMKDPHHKCCFSCIGGHTDMAPANGQEANTQRLRTCTETLSVLNAQMVQYFLEVERGRTVVIGEVIRTPGTVNVVRPRDEEFLVRQDSGGNKYADKTIQHRTLASRFDKAEDDSTLVVAWVKRWINSYGIVDLRTHAYVLRQEELDAWGQTAVNNWADVHTNFTNDDKSAEWCEKLVKSVERARDELNL